MHVLFDRPARVFSAVEGLLSFWENPIRGSCDRTGFDVFSLVFESLIGFPENAIRSSCDR